MKITDIFIPWRWFGNRKVTTQVVEDVQRVAPAIVAKDSMQVSRSQYESLTDTMLDVRDVITVDALAARILERMVHDVVGSGITVSGYDKKAVAHVRKRLAEMEIAGGTPINDIVRMIVKHLLAYGNAFAVLVRDASNASGKPYTYFDGSQLDPIAAVFVPDPATIEVVRNVNGTPVRYRQDISLLNRRPDGWASRMALSYNSSQLSYGYKTGKWSFERKSGVRLFEPQNVVHFKYFAETTEAMGKPVFANIVEDILTLRYIEARMLEIVRDADLVRGVAKVGTEKVPAVQAEVDAMSHILSGGGSSALVLTERQDYKIHTAQLPRLDDWATYFRDRIFLGLGTNPVAMGAAGESNRATADILMSAYYRFVKLVQNVFLDAFNAFVVRQLLLDGGFDPTGVDQRRLAIVKLPDPDVDSMIKWQNQVVYLYEHYCITEDEMREMLGMDPIDEDERRKMRIYTVVEKLNETTLQKPVSQEDGSAETDNRVKPKNQHGEKQGATTRIKP